MGIKVVTCALVVSFVLISVIGLPLEVWFWSFLLLVAISVVYYGTKFHLLFKGKK